MLFAMVVVLVVSARAASDPLTGTMRRALEDAIEPGSVVVLRERGPGNEEDLASVAGTAKADAAAEIAGTAADVELRVYDARSRASARRALHFEPEEVGLERARAIGFIIASMVAGEPQPAPSPYPLEPPRPDDGKLPPTRPPADEPPPRRSELPLGERVPIFAADAAAFGTTGFAGDAMALGGEIGLRAALGSRFGVRAGGGLTVGNADDGALLTRAVRIKGGGAYELARLGAKQPLTLHARGDLVAVLHSVTLRDGSDASASRWVPALSALGEAAWYALPRGALLLDAGAEVALGTTRVFVGDVRRTSIPTLRLVGALGVRVDF